MKLYFLLFAVVAATFPSRSQTTCFNTDFEQSTAGKYTAANAVSGWTVSSQTNTNANNCDFSSGTFTAGSPQFSVVQTPVTGLQCLGTLPHSPFGGTNVVQLNNPQVWPLVIGITNVKTKIARTFSVTAANSLLRYAFAGEYSWSAHGCCDQPMFAVRFLDCNQNPLSCYSHSLQPNAGVCASTLPIQYSNSVIPNPGGNNIYYTGWKVIEADLSPFIGSCVTMEAMSSGCAAGTHAGMTFFDAVCATQPLSGSGFCIGTSSLQLNAPLGYTSYSWSAPGSVFPISPQNATLSSVTVTNPVPGSVYTVNLTNLSGCQFIYTVSPVPITAPTIALSSLASCTDVANGSATVDAGNNSGYSYTWTSAGNPSVIGTGSVINNLFPGVYQVTVNPGAAACAVTASTTVFTIPAHIITIYATPTLVCKGQPATLYATGSSSIHNWHNLGSNTTYSVNPTASTVYTVTAPVSSNYCAASETVLIQVFNPVLTISSTTDTICSGQNVSLTTTGINSIWSNGTSGTVNAVTPTLTTVYSASASITSGSSLACPASGTFQLFVHHNPTVTVFTADSIVCIGGPVVFKAGGATSYEWENGAIGPTVSVVSLTSGTISLEVIGKGTNGCKDSAIASVMITECAGLNTYTVTNAGFSVHPNPSVDAFVLVAGRRMSLEIADGTGKVITMVLLHPENSHRAVIAGLKAGIYVIYCVTEPGIRQKISVMN